MSRLPLALALSIAVLSPVKLMSSGSAHSPGAFTAIRLDSPWRAPVDDFLSLCVRRNAVSAAECVREGIDRDTSIEIARLPVCSSCRWLSGAVSRAMVGAELYAERERRLMTSLAALDRTGTTLE